MSLVISPQVFEFCFDLLFDQRLNKRVRLDFLRNLVRTLERGGSVMGPIKSLMGDLFSDSRREPFHIFTIFDEGVQGLIESLGLTEQIQNGELKCDLCGCPIAYENLECLYIINGEIKACCTSSYCRQSVTSYRSDRSE